MTADGVAVDRPRCACWAARREAGRGVGVLFDC
jgi:hypothetical protein